MKRFGILQELQKCVREMKQANAVGKTIVVIDLLNKVLPQTFP